MIRNLLLGVAVIGFLSSGAFAADQGQIDGTKALIACMSSNNQDDGISDAATIGRVIFSSCDREFKNWSRTYGVPFNENTADRLNKDGLDTATKFVLQQRELFEQAKQCLKEGERRAERLAATAAPLDDLLKRFKRFSEAVRRDFRTCPLYLIEG
jgi:hypothetical protein